MTEFAEEATEIRETDIVFDCPYCGKSLAIDYRGAGLNVRCPDCGRSVQVPIPEGMDIADVDSTQEEQEIRIRNLRKALSSAEERIRELEVEVDRLRAAAAAAPSREPVSPASQAAIRDAAERIRRAVDQIERALDDRLNGAEAARGEAPASQS